MTPLAQAAYAEALAILKRVRDESRDALAREIAAGILETKVEYKSCRCSVCIDKLRAAAAEIRDVSGERAI